MEHRRFFMEAFFDELRQRIDFLPDLRASGRACEAILLCCCYIDGLASNYYFEDEGSHRNFVRIIAAYGGQEFPTRIHPRQLRESLERLRGRQAQAALAAIEQLPK